MQISSQTINILKNFALINPSIAFEPGNELQTVAPSKTIMAKAVIEDTLPTSGAIYDLSRFLGVVSLFEQPEFEFTETQVVVKGPRSSVNYTFADPSMILTPPKDKQITIDNPDVNIDIPGNKIQAVLKAAAVLSLPEIALTNNDGAINLRAIDSKNPSTDTYQEQVSSVGSNNASSSNVDYNFVFKTENFKMMPADYNVKINKQGISQFTANDSLIYWVAVEANSKYES